MAQPTSSTATATAITRKLRPLWPAPITLRTKLVDERTIEITTGPGCRNQAEGAAAYIERATGKPWRVSYIENLRNNIRIIYTVGVPAATFDKIGRPHQWKPGQVDEKTVTARRAAVHGHGLRTGYDAEPGQLVVHVEFGTPGIYVRSEPGCSYVRFAGDTKAELVHPNDVVVLADSTDWIGCWISEDETHLDHDQAVTPECILGDPPAKLEGPELVEVSPKCWKAADGIFVTADRADGTFWAYDERGIPGATGTDRDRIICANQTSLEETHRPINRRRAAVAEHYTAAYEIAASVDAAITTVTEMRAAYENAKAAWSEAFHAGRPGNYERKIENRARMGVARAELHLAHLLDDRSSRVITVEASYDDGCTWDMFGASTIRIGDLGRETPAAQALRYALANRWAGPDRWRAEPHPLRVRVYTNPLSLLADGEWSNFTPEPCPAGQHDNGEHSCGRGLARADGSTVETSTCDRCFRKIWRVRPIPSEPDAQPYPWLLEGEPLPDVDPTVIYLPIECVLTRHYGMEINDGFGTWQTLVAVGPVDPDTERVEVFTIGCRKPAALRAGTNVQLRPAPGQGLGLGPGPDGTHPDPDPDLSRDAAAIIAGLGPDLQRAELGYRVSARTQTGWRTIGTGTLPPIFPAVRTGLGLAAETVLGNARQIAGLGPQDPMPEITVQTWHRWSGLTATATRTN